jgi:Rrf2 family protein
MLITRKVDYGFQALYYIASSGNNRRCSIQEIASAEDIPQKFLSTVLNDLVQAKILISHQGPRGGYQLGKPASRITFRNVISALGGDIQINACTARPSQCKRKACAYKPYWKGVQRQLDYALQSLSISDVVFK